MASEQTETAPYLELVNGLSLHLQQLKQLLGDPGSRLTTSDARYLVGGQIAGLAQKFKDLAREIENTPD